MKMHWEFSGNSSVERSYDPFKAFKYYPRRVRVSGSIFWKADSQASDELCWGGVNTAVAAALVEANYGPPKCS